MKLSRAALWQELIELSPLCSGSLHQQYLPCGKANCRCHDRLSPRRHGPYYLWRRHLKGRQVNRTLRPGPEVERVKAGIANYHRFQALFSQLLEHEERQMLSVERALTVGGKKNFRKRFRRV